TVVMLPTLRAGDRNRLGIRASRRPYATRERHRITPAAPRVSAAAGVPAAAAGPRMPEVQPARQAGPAAPGTRPARQAGPAAPGVRPVRREPPALRARWEPPALRARWRRTAARAGSPLPERSRGASPGRRGRTPRPNPEHAPSTRR